jgi:hypothetical protein
VHGHEVDDHRFGGRDADADADRTAAGREPVIAADELLTSVARTPPKIPNSSA